MSAEVAHPTHVLDRTRTLVAGAVVALALLPLVFIGPGTDLDAAAVIRAGRSIVEDQTYRASRPPGAPVHETAVGLLEAIGGTVGSNLGSLAAAGAVIALLVALLRRCGVGRSRLVTTVMVANPWFLIAATSTVDFLWALAFLLGAAVLLRSGRAVPAGMCGALAVGCRASTLALVAALVLAEALEGDGGRRRAVIMAAVTVAGAALLFVPSFRASGDSFAFVQNDVPTSSPLVHAGRFAAKDLYLVGPFAAVVLLLCIPPVLRALRGWRADWLIRFSSTGLVISQLLFLRFPWKIGHLLPSLVLLVLLLGVALRDRPRLLVALCAAQLAYAAVNVVLVQPDVANAATSGRLTFDPAWGVLVIDAQCRADDPDAWKTPTRTDDDQVWNCAKPWSG